MGDTSTHKVRSINLLETFDAQALERLRRKHPAHLSLFDADKQGVADAPTAVAAELALATLETVAIEAEDILATAVERIRGADRLESIAGTAAAIGGTLTALATAMSVPLMPWTSTAAVLTVGAALVKAFAGSRKKGVLGTDLATSVTSLLQTSQQANLAARRLRRYLDPDDANDYSKQANDLIGKSEELAGAVLVAARTIGQKAPRGQLTVATA